MRLVRQLVAFTSIGAIGFCIDAGLLVLGHDLLGLDWAIARLPSFTVAATTTWLLNRRFTFDARAGSDELAEWRNYLAVNIGGAMINLGAFLVLIRFVPLLHDRPVVTLAISAAVALAFNFLGSRHFVFRTSLRERGTAGRG